jgi:hypothetical protein
VREVELGVEGGDPRGRKALIEAGAVRVAERLAGAGSDDYEGFRRAALAAEVAARDAALTGVSRSRDLSDAEAGLRTVVELLAETSFRAAAAKIQAEMMTAFADELLDESVSTAEAAPQLRLLAEAIAEASEAVCASIAAVDENLDRLARVSRAAAPRRDPRARDQRAHRGRPRPGHRAGPRPVRGDRQAGRGRGW